jgi:prepilin-type N-terminal cleavage/methylation domain-containing protein
MAKRTNTGMKKSPCAVSGDSVHRSGERHGKPLLCCKCGFTLLELMVSFMIIAMMVGILTGALRLGIKSVISGEERIDALERLGSSVRIISSQIQSLNALTFLEDEEKRYFFEGDSESLRFSSNYAVWGGQKGYVLVTYTIQGDDTEGLHLTVSESTLGFESERETLLLDSLESASFEYFHRDPLEEEGEWLDTWDDTKRLPAKIGLNFVRGDDEFSLRFPIRVTGSTPQVTAGIGVGSTPGGTREPEPEEDPDWRPRSQR